MDYEEILNKPTLRFEARGDTYPHRAEFRSFAWRWNPAEHYWFLEAEMGTEEDDLVVVRARDLDGVEIRMIDVETGEMKILGPLNG